MVSYWVWYFDGEVWVLDKSDYIDGLYGCGGYFFDILFFILLWGIIRVIIIIEQLIYISRFLYYIINYVLKDGYYVFKDS